MPKLPNSLNFHGFCVPERIVQRRFGMRVRAAAFVVVVAGGCAKPAVSPAPSGSEGDGRMAFGPLTQESVLCKPSLASASVQSIDANRNGQVEEFRVMRPVETRQPPQGDATANKSLCAQCMCRSLDLDDDGVSEIIEHFSDDGQLQRRYIRFDANAPAHVVEWFDHGKLVLRNFDTRGKGRIDTHDVFDPATGRRLRRERDTSGDGIVDEWWTFDKDGITVQSDRDGDGAPDLTGKVTLPVSPQKLPEPPR